MKARKQSKQRSIPNESDIDDLVRFLPKLRSLKGKYATRHAGLERGPDGVYSLVPPKYVPIVIDFFGAAAKPCWSDYEYKPEKTARMFENAKVIQKASINQIRTILTWCVRGERYCDGHWSAVLSSGRIFDVLERLKKLRKVPVRHQKPRV